MLFVQDEVRLDAPPANQVALDDGLDELRANVWPLERVSLKDKQQADIEDEPLYVDLETLSDLFLKGKTIFL